MCVSEGVPPVNPSTRRYSTIFGMSVASVASAAAVAGCGSNARASTPQHGSAATTGEAHNASNGSLLFPVDGLLAVDGFRAADVVSGRFSLASNGQMTFDNKIALTGAIDYQSGKLSETNNACAGTCATDAQTAPIAVPAVPQSAYSAARTANDDSAVSWGNQFTTDASTYTVSSNGSNDATVEIPAGTYFYCNLSLGNHTTLKTTSWPVKIYVDSREDTAGACNANGRGAGTLSGSNDLVVANSSGLASNVQIYLYGDPGCTRRCPDDLSPNSQSYTADIYAPNSSATVGGPFTMTGALVIGRLTTNNVLRFNFQKPASGS
jgi:hypothetical protein